MSSKTSPTDHTCPRWSTYDPGPCGICDAREAEIAADEEVAETVRRIAAGIPGVVIGTPLRMPVSNEDRKKAIEELIRQSRKREPE